MMQLKMLLNCIALQIFVTYLFTIQHTEQYLYNHTYIRAFIHFTDTKDIN